MIDKTLIEGLDLNKTEAKTQINNFWNYLDELASKNPEEYKKFIKAQMEKGLSMAESIKKEKEQSNDIEIDNLLFERTKEEDEEIQKLEKIYQDKLKEIERLTNEIKIKDDEIILMNKITNKNRKYFILTSRA